MAKFDQAAEPPRRCSTAIREQIEAASVRFKAGSVRRIAQRKR